MKKILKNYKSTLILLLAIIIGAIVGIIFKEDAKVLSPLGDIFINLLLVVIVPLVFLTITTSIAKMSTPKRLGKIMITTIVAFLVTSIVAVIVGFITTYNIDLVKPEDTAKITSTLVNEEMKNEDLSILERTADVLTVKSFNDLLTTDNLIALLVFSILFGIGTLMAAESGKSIAKFVQSGSAVMMKVINIIMMAAPIGLGCYFANVIGELGSQLLSGYLRVTILYLILTAVIYFGLFTLYAFIAGGKDGIKAFWSNAVSPTVTSLATCSSAASIPVNLDATKKMGVPEDIAETVIPLGANVHKDGSVVTGVLKIAFLLGLLGTNMNTIPMMLAILGVAFINGAVMGAIPGGGFMSEMLIVSAFGIDPALLPIIVVIGTILDAPATLLNSTENTVCAMLVARLVEGKDWLKNKINN